MYLVVVILIMKRTIIICTLLLAVCIAGIAIYNYTALAMPVGDKLHADPGTRYMHIKVHYKHYVQTGTLVFDMISPGPTGTEADVFKALMLTARALKNEHFSTVELCYKGELKFTCKGSFFRDMGADYIADPLYMARFFPEQLYYPNGQPAYYHRQAGTTAQVQHDQLRDFTDCCNKWMGSGLQNHFIPAAGTEL